MPPITIKPLKTKKDASVTTATNQEEAKERLKAIRITVEMSDGSIFEAVGNNADAIWNYQMECEQLANAVGTMPSYLGPGMVRVPAK